MEVHLDSSPHTTTSNPPAVFVNNLSFRYRSFEDEDGATTGKTAQANPLAIEDISFSLPKGKLMLIAGPSGCGKSTLLKCLNGLIPHSYKGALSGEIQLVGRSIRGLSLRELSQHIGTMLQDSDKQIMGSTVQQGVAFGM